MNILEDKQNPFLNRRELKFLIEADKNPALSEVAETLSTKLETEKDAIEIKKIKGKFGRNTFLISAFVYTNKEERKKFETKTKKQTVQQQSQAAIQKAPS